jgi:hypothetical protein
MYFQSDWTQNLNEETAAYIGNKTEKDGFLKVIF